MSRTSDNPYFLNIHVLQLSPMKVFQTRKLHVSGGGVPCKAGPGPGPTG